MKLFIAGVLATLCVGIIAVDAQTEAQAKLVCYWNATSVGRTGLGKFQVDDLHPALSLCTHLIFGFVGIDATTLKATFLNPGGSRSSFRKVTELKTAFPDVKIYLGVGGNADPEEDTHKYLVVTETVENRKKFIDSIVSLFGEFDFDGVDLAWQFPVLKVIRKPNPVKSIWKGFKNIIGQGNFHDQKEELHRDGFTLLVRELKAQLRTKNNKDLTLSILPHINKTTYYNARSLQPNTDAVHILAFDQKTPDRNPEEADYPSPIYGSYGRVAENNIDAGVKYWTDGGVPKSKIVVGIPAFARTWKLTAESQVSGVPPVITEGPGAEGQQTATPGLLSYPEVCPRVAASSPNRLTSYSDPSKKYGSYAFQPYDKTSRTDGIWVGFEDPGTAGNKADYVKVKGLAGAAVFDLSLDDFRGACSGERFPITKAIKNNL